MPAPAAVDTRGSTTENAKTAPSTPGSWAKVKNNATGGKPGHAKRSRLTRSQALRFVRRLLIVLAAVTFVCIELVATYKTVAVLRNADIPEHDYGNYKSNFIGKFLGTGAIRDSPLVMDVLGNDTTPRDATIYIASETTAGFEQCETAKKAGLYDDAPLRTAFTYFARSTAYNITFLNEVEPIVSVVDCSFEGMLADDISLARVYHLVRNLSDPEDVYIIGMALSLQEYRVPQHSRAGPAFVSFMSTVHDMRATAVSTNMFITLDYPFVETPVFYVCERIGLSPDGFRVLRTISRHPETDPPLTVLTARRRGIYFNSEADQSNIATMYRKIELHDPLVALTESQWVGKPVITDSWAWVHGIHFVFGMQTFFSTTVLSVIMLRNWRQGKIWVGDAFAALSNGTLTIRLLLVLASWHVNEYWVLTEFSLANGSKMSDQYSIPIHDELVAADMLVLMLGLISLIGQAARERIDPGFAMLLFVVIHSNRLLVISIAPALSDYLSSYANAEYFDGITTLPPAESTVTPLRLWTTRRLEDVDTIFLFKSFFPKMVLLVLVVCFVVVRKAYFRVYPNKEIERSRHSTKKSSGSESELVEKRSLTVFELATGALLRSRFGLISDYNNYVFIKGLKFASADGIYCSGYVIANGKFLVATDDIFAIALMKLLRSRLYNVYVYDVEGNSVQRTARLVYPDTLSWKDLTRLNTTILS